MVSSKPTKHSRATHPAAPHHTTQVRHGLAVTPFAVAGENPSSTSRNRSDLTVDFPVAGLQVLDTSAQNPCTISAITSQTPGNSCAHCGAQGQRKTRSPPQRRGPW
jgi:hypothetical protein